MYTASAVGLGVNKPTAVRVFLALLVLCWHPLAAGGEAFNSPAETVVAAAEIQRPHLDVKTSPLLQLDPAEAGSPASRIDLTLLPRADSGIGLSMGIRSRSQPGAGMTPDQSHAPAVDLGLHWRYTSQNNRRFDVTAYRRAPQAHAATLAEDREPGYGARVELGMASQKDLRKGFVADRGFVGMQLESGGRLTIRRKFGGPMLYYRNTFY